MDITYAVLRVSTESHHIILTLILIHAFIRTCTQVHRIHTKSDMTDGRGWVGVGLDRQALLKL